MERRLFYRRALIFGVKENDEGHPPHGDVAAKFRDKTRQLLIEQRRQM
jgi:hypothetical protein